VASRLVRTVVNDKLPAGDHTATWSGRDHTGHRVAPGPYFVRLQAGGEVRTGTVVFLGD
jgi:flagellar hook assembly protein FlgD